MGIPGGAELGYGISISKLEQTQSGIETLTPEEIRLLREWLAELDARLFDDKIRRDAESGKLDALAETVLADHGAGRCRQL